MRLETGCEPCDFLAPLTHDRLRDDDQRSGFWVNEHCCDQLDRLAQAHLIAQEAPGVTRVEFALREPSNSVVLIGCDQAGLETRHPFFCLISPDPVYTLTFT